MSQNKIQTTKIEFLDNDGSVGSELVLSDGTIYMDGEPIQAGAHPPVDIDLTENHILVGNASNEATDVAMSGEASIVASGAVTLSNSAVIGKVLTGYVSGAGTVSASDSLLQAIQKLNGNLLALIPASWGTFTPTVAVAGGGTVPQYTTNDGQYNIVNKVVFVDVLLTGDGGNEGAGAGIVSVALPTAAHASAATGPFPIGSAINGANTGIPLYGQIAAGASTVTLYYQDHGGFNLYDFTGGDQNNATRQIRLKFFYRGA